MAKQQNTASADGAPTTGSNILPFVRTAPAAPLKAPREGRRATVDKVVHIRGHLARPEMVEATSELLEQMKRGEQTGVMYFAAGAAGM